MASMNVYNMSTKALRAEIRTYGGKVSGLQTELCKRVKRLRKKEYIASDFPYGKIPLQYQQPALEPMDGKETFNDDCCICMEEIKTDGVKTSCNHGYHKKCLNKWLKEDSRCPMCRQNIGKVEKKQRVAQTYIQGILGVEEPYVSPSILNRVNRPVLVRSDTSSRDMMTDRMNEILLESAIARQSITIGHINRARQHRDQNALVMHSLDLADITRRIQRLMNN